MFHVAHAIDLRNPQRSLSESTFEYEHPYRLVATLLSSKGYLRSASNAGHDRKVFALLIVIMLTSTNEAILLYTNAIWLPFPIVAFQLRQDRALVGCASTPIEDQFRCGTTYNSHAIHIADSVGFTITFVVHFVMYRRAEPCLAFVPWRAELAILWEGCRRGCGLECEEC